MATNTSNTQHLSSTAQQYLEIADITNDLVILKDGSAALVLELSAINFGLLSEPEQDAIIYAYAALINSLSFPIQIVISSRPKDVSQYLEFIDEQYATATTDLRRNQIASYKHFVSNLITEQNVLDKNFFVVISLSPIEVGVTSPSGFLNVLVPNAAPTQKIDTIAVIEKARNILGPRRDHLINQFSRFGLRAQQLTTKELIHEFYVLYNGQSAEGAKIVDTSEYTSALIQTYGGQTSAAPVTQTAPVATPAPVAAPVPAPEVAAPPVQEVAPTNTAPLQPTPTEIAAMPPVNPTTVSQPTAFPTLAGIPQESVGLSVPGASPVTSQTQPR